MAGRQVPCGLTVILAADVAGCGRPRGADEEGALASLPTIRCALGARKVEQTAFHIGINLDGRDGERRPSRLGHVR